MRTVIAPYLPEVKAELAALDPRLREIARRYVRRLALEPYLGYPLQRGRLAHERCRAVRFDHGHRWRVSRRSTHDQPAGQVSFTRRPCVFVSSPRP